MSEILYRTASGLANQHLFFDVDFVVYSEGGSEWASLEEAIRGGSDETPDAAYWRAVFAACRPNAAVHIKSVGSRRVAKEIGRLAREAGADTVVVCTDADLDWVPPLPPAEANEIRSWAYSWESDLAELSVLHCVFVRLRGNAARAQAVMQELSAWHEAFLASCVGHVVNDARRIRAGAAGVFDRTNPVRNLTIGAGRTPALDGGLLVERNGAAMPEGCVLQEIADHEISVRRHCFGKVLLRACYHAVSHFIQRVRRGRVDFDTFVDLAIDCFRQTLVDDAEKFAYYDGRLPVV